MADNTALPAGLVLDAQPAETPAATNSLPPGLTLDQPVTVPTVQPTGDLTQDVPARLKSAAVDTMAGITALPNSAAHFADWLGKKANLDIGAEHALSMVPNLRDHNRSFFPDYQTASDTFHNGFDVPVYQPETRLGRDAQAGLSAVMGAPGNVPAALANMFGGMTANEFGEWAQRTGFMNPTIAAMLGFTIGGKTAAGVGNAGMRVAATAVGAPTTDRFAAYERQGVPTDLSGDVSGNNSLQWLQATASQGPGSSSTINDLHHAATAAWGDAIDRAASTLRPNVNTMQDAGNVVRTAYQDWLTRLQNLQTMAGNYFRSALPANTPANTSNTLHTLTDLSHNFGPATNLQAEFGPSLWNKMQDAILADQSQGNMTFGALHELRKDVGNRMAQPSVEINSPAQASLKRVYGAITDDMDMSIPQHNTVARHAFNTLNDVTRGMHDVIDTYVKPYGVSNPAVPPEAVANNLLRTGTAGGSVLQGYGTHMPDAANALGAYQLRAMAGMSDPNTAPNPVGFATAVSGRRPVMRPEARDALYGSSPIAGDVADLTNIAQGMRDTASKRNFSNSAPHVAGSSIASLLLAKEGAEAGYDLAGHWTGGVGGALAGLAAPTLAGKATAAFVANPWLSRLYSTKVPFELTAPGQFSGLFPPVPNISGIGARAPLYNRSYGNQDR